MNTKGKWITWIDIAKGLGIVFIVLGHTLPHSFVRQILFSFNAQLFFFLSGLTYRLEPSLSIFLKKRIKGLMAPYWIWGIISISIILTINSFLHIQKKNIGVLTNLFGLLYANSRTELMWWNRPLWFIPCLFITLTVVDIIERTVLRSGKEYKRYIVIIISIFGMMISDYPSHWYLPFQMETAFGMVGFIELGILFKKCRVDKRVRQLNLIIKIPIFFLCIGIGIVLSAFNGSAGLRTYRYGTYPILFIATSMLFSFAIIVLAISIYKNKFLELLGRWSLCIMLFHKFPILLFQEIIPISKEFLSGYFYNSGATLICAIFVSLISILLCIIVGKIVILVAPELIGQKLSRPAKNENPVSH